MGRRGYRLHRDIRQARRYGAPALAIAIALALACGPARAQVVADTAPGRNVGTSVLHSGNAWSITGGTTIGGVNLFHSFSQFGVPAADTATFSGAGGISNIIARVTGGARSDIYGTLSSTISGANLWFMNPAGIAFGPNAQLNVQGSFHASTASYLRFGANGQFNMSDVPAGTLTVNPSAFGFLGAPAPITLDRSELNVPAGRTLSLVGGDITATGTLAARARIEAPGGRINIASVAGAGEAVFAPSGLLEAPTGALGTITLANTIVRTEIAGPPGPIAIRGGKLVLRDSFISTSHNSTASGADIDIALSGDFSMSGGVIRTSTLGSGDAGNVAIRAASMLMAGGAVIDSSSFDLDTRTGDGRAGQISINATGDVLLTGGSALSGVTIGVGPAGDMRINARSLTLTENANINVRTFGDGDGGTVRIAVQDLKLSGGGQIAADTVFDLAVAPAQGNGGNIFVSAVNRVEIGGAGSGMFSETLSDGAGGLIVINAGDIALRDGGQIGSRSLSPYGVTSGNAGSIRLAAARTVDIAGAGSGIFSSTVTPGAGGAIAIAAQDILIRDGARISAESSNPNNVALVGNAGAIQFAAARTVEIAGAGSGLFSSTTSSGAGGTIEVSAQDILIRDGGRISGESSNPNNFARVGDAGSIALSAARSIRLAGDGGITTESVGAGGGRIVIQAGDLLALDRSRITTSVRFGGGNGGDILIDPVFVILNASDIIARAVDGNGGNIFIVTQFLLQSPDSSIDATSQRGISGSVQISSPASDVGSRLGVLGSGYIDPSALLREACAARAGRAGSSFVGVGRGGLPASPDSAAYAGYAPASAGSSREAWMGLTIRTASCPGPHTG